MRIASRLMGITFAVIGLATLGGCATFVASAGPRTAAITDAPQSASLRGIELVEANYAVANALKKESEAHRFSSFFTEPRLTDYHVGAGDVLQIYIWEAPPAMLFTPQSLIGSGITTGGTGTVVLPEQLVGNTGDVAVPFAGKIDVTGLTLSQIETRIVTRLRGKANHPQVIVRLVRNNTQNVTVVGNVQHSMEVPMTPGGVKLLRALAMSGGVTKPVEKTTIQISRAGRVMTLPLEAILRSPQDNIGLRPGDVVTALYQPLSFTALGAIGKNGEVDFEANGINLAQALARIGGLNDNRSNPAGVFLFRLVPPNALPWPQKPTTLIDGKVPTIFQFNLRDPATFFVAQSFPVENKDLIYVSDAPAADLQKVLNVVGSIVYPFQTLNAFGVIH
ncbi:MAG: polysaccharide export protein [Proteobacteria bacterium]|nr:polysaccharide export protein [Pseudomonadota bacterium]